MASQQLSYRTSLRRVINMTTSTAAVNSTPMDTANFEGVRFVAMFGTRSSAAATVKLQMAASTTATFVDIAGSGVALTTAANQIISLEVYRARKRYVRCVQSALSSTTQKLGAVAIAYSPRKLSQTTLDHSSVGGRVVLASASSGTA